MAVTLLTGNALISGHVLWWTGSGWSKSLADAVPLAAADGEAALAAAVAGGRINDAALIEAEMDGPGRFRPLRMRERIRAGGPTVPLPTGASAAGEGVSDVSL
jgi:hypothetical protein